MIDKIFDLLGQNPTISIIAIVVLLVFFMFIFKEQIKKYITKKFNLYDDKDMIEFAKFSDLTKKQDNYLANDLENFKKIKDAKNG